jgi:predicted ATP-grasp superfamily ATP-dependent carboligase
MSHRVVTVVETVPVDGVKYCLIGVPDVGLVNTIALGYIIRAKQMGDVGYLESDAFPPVIVVHDGTPKPIFRLYRTDDVVAVFSEIPIDARLITPVARAIVAWAKAKRVELVVAASGIGVPNRLEIDVPEVYGVGSTPAVTARLTTAGIPLLEEGFVTGLHAVVMQESVKQGVPSLLLLTQSHLTYPDPEAAAYATTSLNDLLELKVDVHDLLAQSEEFRVKMRALMQRTQHEMQRAQTGRDQEIPPLYS